MPGELRREIMCARSAWNRGTIFPHCYDSWHQWIPIATHNSRSAPPHAPRQSRWIFVTYGAALLSPNTRISNVHGIRPRELCHRMPRLSRRQTGCIVQRDHVIRPGNLVNNPRVQNRRRADGRLLLPDAYHTLRSAPLVLRFAIFSLVPRKPRSCADRGRTHDHAHLTSDASPAHEWRTTIPCFTVTRQRIHVRPQKTSVPFHFPDCDTPYARSRLVLFSNVIGTSKPSFLHCRRPAREGLFLRVDNLRMLVQML